MIRNDTNKIKKTEILAPAGSMEHLVYAVRAGANAVYLGTQNFNARKKAKNFDNDELIEAVKYCHERNVKLYVTLNTLVFDDEIDTLINHIKFLAHAGIDAVIVQDMAVAKIVSQAVPSLNMHASTQMTIHSAEGVNAAESLGFKRVVLARELNINEIQKIKSKSNIEVEVFVHGALCVSVSGACYLSSVLGLRSGNRGNCAQPCRLNFKSKNREYAISLKDLCTINHIKKLSEIGVESFKIEGRMKRPEYVALSVKAYSDALEGKDTDISLLEDVFSRSGFTDGYLTAKRDLDMYGHRTIEDKIASAKALSKAGEIIRWERQSIPIFVNLEIESDGTYSFSVSDKQNTFTKVGIALPAKERPLKHDIALKTLAKTGGTPYFVKDFNFTNPSSMFIPLSELNHMRREALDYLSEKRQTVKPHCFTSFSYEKSQATESKNPEIWLRFYKYEQYFEQDSNHIIFPLSGIENHIDLIYKLNSRLIGEIPELIFEDNFENVYLTLKELKNKGLTKVLAHNISTISVAKKLGFEVFGGYGLNITNSIAASFYYDMGIDNITLSFELSAKRISNFFGNYKRGVISYGYLPLMKFRNCPIKDSNGFCKSCNGNGSLIDRKNIQFPLICSNKHYTTMLNSLPLYTANKKLDNIDFQILQFTIESQKECKNVYDNFLNKEKLSGDITSALFFRDVL